MSYSYVFIELLSVAKLVEPKQKSQKEKGHKILSPHCQQLSSMKEIPPWGLIYIVQLFQINIETMKGVENRYCLVDPTMLQLIVVHMPTLSGRYCGNNEWHHLEWAT